MNSYFAIIKQGFSPRIVSLAIDINAQNVLNSEFKRCKDDFNNVEPEEYYTGYQSEDNSELFYIDKFNLDINVFDALENPTNQKVFDINEIGIENIIAIFTSGNSHEECLVQYYNSNNFIKMSKTVFMTDKTKEMTSGHINGFSIANKLVAVLRKKDDNIRIIFRSFDLARRVFTTLDDYFKEATDEELKSFISSHFDADPNFNILEIANKNTRKKVTQLNKHKILDNKTADEIKEMASKFEFELNISPQSKKVLIPNNIRDINELLSGFASLIYQSPITGERMKANAARPYPKKK
ncbi:hypothetical protein GV127_07360 [Pasteurella multocida]|uniref:hypothetical protein n=1 Tax=Pasteurella multocida TaxID=747 RepID=UPI001398DD7B|nr:hypothetical protein [Pasteurella multocida]QHZ98030.1 hypothetical protein GV127_07360 [Pasteurella multocida]